MANYEFATNSTKLLQQIISTKVRPSVSSEGRYKYCQRLSLEASRGAGTSCDVSSLGLVGMGEEGPYSSSVLTLKLQTGTNPLPLLQRDTSNLLLPSRPFCLEVAMPFLLMRKKKATKHVGQAVLAKVFKYCCMREEQDIKRNYKTASLVMLSHLSSRRERTIFLSGFSSVLLLAAFVLAYAPGCNSSDQAALGSSWHI